jgi:hypothetical protein
MELCFGQSVSLSPNFDMIVLNRVSVSVMSCGVLLADEQREHKVDVVIPITKPSKTSRI